MNARTLLFVLVAGCDELPLQIDLTRDGVVLDDLPDEVVDACDLWGIDCAIAGPEGPSIRLDLRTGIPDGENGSTTDHSACRKAGWAAAGRPLVVAHELGHMFGLVRGRNGEVGHSSDPHNLMFWRDSDGHTTEAQRGRVRRNVARFAYLGRLCT